MKRKAYKPTGKMFGAVLTGMRETAFGNKAKAEVWKITENAARMRDDQGLLAAAEAKRARKLEKRKALA